MARWHWVAVLLLGVLLASPAAWRWRVRRDGAGAGDDESPVADAVRRRFEQWMALHGREYENEEEMKRRLRIFLRNLEFVESFNRGADRRGYRLSLSSRFADRSDEEIRNSNYGLADDESDDHILLYSSRGSRYAGVSDQDLPPSKDWRDEGAVNPIRDQGACGSCWAFAAVAATEGITEINTGTLLSLSEQQLVDCDTNDSGCDGGLAYRAFKYVRDNGLASRDAYPYQAKESGSCSPAAQSPAAYITGYEAVTPNDEQALLRAVANQPVAVSVASGSPEFHHYDGDGVFTGPCGDRLNHAVTLVGYGTTDDGTQYWILRNSWGESWGDGGYMKILKNNTYTNGTCGLAIRPSYPVA